VDWNILFAIYITVATPVLQRLRFLLVKMWCWVMDVLVFLYWYQ
jgi:hypothetical protein